MDGRRSDGAMDDAELIELSDDQGLAFLNSVAKPQGRRIEMLGDGAALLSWLRGAALIEDADAATIGAAFSPDQLDAVAAEARALREDLRPAIADWAAGTRLSGLRHVRARLNELLSLDARYDRIDDGGIHQLRRWSSARQLLVPPAAAVAVLLADGDPALVRKCESAPCTLWFYDRTKAHRRRWCSMGLCGNRAKARAHRARLIASRTAN